MICSSTLLVVNKVCLSRFPHPTFLLAAQFASSSVVAGLLAHRSVTLERFGLFMTLSLAFYACLYANMGALSHVNVDTIIVARCSLPVLLCWFEYLFLARELPTRRSFLSIVATLGAAIGYTAFEQTSFHGYAWLGAWYGILCFDAIFIKHRVDNVEVDTNWERVAYQNAWSTLFSVPIFVLSPSRHATLVALRWLEATDWALLACSLVMGVAMSYFANECRSVLTATTFTIVGNVCKVLTVFINILIWNKHATSAGLGCLAAALAASMAYQSAPKRAADVEEKVTLKSHEEDGA